MTDDEALAALIEVFEMGADTRWPDMVARVELAREAESLLRDLAERQDYERDGVQWAEQAAHDLHGDLTDLESYSCRGLDAAAALGEPNACSTDHDSLRMAIQTVTERFIALQKHTPGETE